jgi:hypothetical protein
MMNKDTEYHAQALVQAEALLITIRKNNKKSSGGAS